MSDIKSYQRLLAVQALYEFSINKRSMDDSFDELLLHIVENRTPISNTVLTCSSVKQATERSSKKLNRAREAVLAAISVLKN